MSLPVPYHPGETRHEIRNTVGGKFLFIPNELIRSAFCFIIATAARRYNVGIVAFAMMANHIHLLVVDLGEKECSDIPDFRQFVRSTFAQFINWHWGISGRVFCPDSIGQSINVVDFESVEDAITYIELNPVNAGMERSPELMRGAVSLRKWLLEPVRIERPKVFFREQSWAEYEELQLVVPPCAKARGYDRESYYELTKRNLDRRLKETLRERKEEGLKSRPLHVLVRMNHEITKGESASDHSEVLISCNDPVRRALELEKIRIFRRQHALALRRLQNGERDVVFPPGTYRAVKRYGANATRPNKPPGYPQLA